MNNFLLRTATAIVYGCTIIGSILIHKWLFLSVMLVLTTFSLFEFYTLLKQGGIKNYRGYGVVVGTVVFCLFSLTAIGWLADKFNALALFLLFGLFILPLYDKEEDGWKRALTTTGGILYVVLPMILLIQLAFIDKKYQPALPLTIFILIWANDTFAYLTGKLLGKHKLFERISPNKTWEGFFGGAIATLIAGWLLIHFYHYMHPADIWAMAAIVIIAGTVGDLAESLLKRQLGVKDSGKLLPGHGGLLDRIDALLFALPFFYAYLVVF